MPQPKPDPRQWVTKKQACKYLGVSERQVERRMDAGQLRRLVLPRESGQATHQIRVHVEDLRALRRGTPNFHPVAEKDEPVLAEIKQIPAAGPAENTTEIAATPDPIVVAPESKAILPMAGVVIERLAHLLGPVQPEPKPWLSVVEAAEYSGLPLGFLRQLAPRLEASGDVVNVSSGSRPRWKIRRAALDGPIAPACAVSAHENEDDGPAPQPYPENAKGAN